MAETVVENEICESCGVDVREGSDFCYNCGEAVSARAIEHSRAVEQDSPKANGFKTELEIKFKDSAPEPSKLRTASDIQKHSKSYQRKRVEMVWVEPGGPSPTFIFTAVIMTAVAVVLLVLAMYLR